MSQRKNPGNLKVVSGAELRARREQRAAAADPAAEAKRRAQTIRDGLDRLTTLTEAIIEAFRQEDWKTLGYTSFTAYTLAEFGDRLNVSPAQRSVLAIAFVEAGLSRRAAAAAIGVDESTIRQDLKGAGNPAPREKSALVSGSTPDADAPTSDTSTGVEEPPVEAQAAAEERTAAADESRHSEAVDSPEPGGGGDEDVAVSGPDHLGVAAPGEASADTGRASVSGAGSRAPEHVETAGVSTGPREAPAVAQEQELDEEEGPYDSDPDLLVRTVEGWAWAFDDTDVDVIGPLLSENQLVRLEVAADVIAEKVALLRAWNERD